MTRSPARAITISGWNGSTDTGEIGRGVENALLGEALFGWKSQLFGFFRPQDA